MTKYSKGTKFVVCSREEILRRGWKILLGGIQPSEKLHSDDFPNLSLSTSALRHHEGETLIVDYESSIFPDWYWVTGNCFRWPVGAFLKTASQTSSVSVGHICIEGMTILDGWFICKICGDNLREIK